MRDFLALAWAALIVIGVVSSIVSSVRKQIASRTPQSVQTPQAAQTQQAAQRPERPQSFAAAMAAGPTTAYTRPVSRVPGAPAAPAPPPAAVRVRRTTPRVAPPVAPPSRPAPAAAAPPVRHEPLPGHESVRRRQSPIARLFRDRSSLARSIVAAEVLGKPRALHDEYFTT